MHRDDDTDATGYGLLYPNVGTGTTCCVDLYWPEVLSVTITALIPPDPLRGSKSPLWKRKAKNRRKSALAKHHRRVMKLRASGYTGPVPKRPPKPKERKR